MLLGHSGFRSIPPSGIGTQDINPTAETGVLLKSITLSPVILSGCYGGKIVKLVRKQLRTNLTERQEDACKQKEGDFHFAPCGYFFGEMDSVASIASRNSASIPKAAVYEL